MVHLYVARLQVTTVGRHGWSPPAGRRHPSPGLDRVNLVWLVSLRLRATQQPMPMGAPPLPPALPAVPPPVLLPARLQPPALRLLLLARFSPHMRRLESEAQSAGSAAWHRKEGARQTRQSRDREA